MENIKENIKEIEKIGKNQKNLQEKIDALENKWTDLYEKGKEYFEKNNTTYKTETEKINAEIQDLRKKQEQNRIKTAIIKNNIHYLLKEDFEGIKEKMIDYFKNKKIGEKTKEKMQNEINEYFQNNYGVNLKCYISFISYGLKFCFVFLDKEGYKNFLFEYNEDFEIYFENNKYKENTFEITYKNDIKEYIKIEDLNKKSKEIQNIYLKTINGIEKYRLKQKELYENIKEINRGFLYETLKIETDLKIYL